MKKILVVVLTISITIGLFIGWKSFGNRKNDQMNCAQVQSQNDDLKKFLSAIAPIDTAFRKHYEISRNHQLQAGYILNSKNDLDAAFKVEALENIKSTQEDLEEFKNTAICFKNSKNFHVRVLAQECITLHKYACVILEQQYHFISSPQEYFSSNVGIDTLKKYTSLFIEQYEYLSKLMKEAVDAESAQGLNSEEAPIAFQYSKEELNSMAKWKKKDWGELTTAALNGDAAGLYMIGMAHLYGQGGFPINIEQANKYFAASASLGFAPALDKIKFMYMEDDKNPFLALVYANLTASFGHIEATMAYHRLRQKHETAREQSIITEIERIASKKMLKIYETINQVEKAKTMGKIAPFSLYGEQIITYEDSDFGMDHWKKIFDEKAE